MALALDGSTSNTVTGPASLTLTLSTTSTNDVIVVDIAPNGAPIVSVTSSHLTFTRHAIVGSNPFTLERWYAIAASTLSSEVITVTMTSAGPLLTAFAYGISGANTSSPWDSGGPQTSGSDPLSITTANANTMVLATFRMGSTASPTAGSTFTSIAPIAGFAISEYKIVSSIGTYSCTLTTGAGNANGVIVDAVVAASSGVPTGWSNFSDFGQVNLRTIVAASAQQWSGFQPRTFPSPQGGAARFFDSGIPPPSAARQPFAGFQPEGTIVSTTPQGFPRFFDSGPAPSTAANHPWMSAFTPEGQIFSITPHGFPDFFDEGPAPATAAQQLWTGAFVPRGTIVSTTPQGFSKFFDSGPAPPSSSRQQWSAFQVRGIIVSVTPSGWGNFFDSDPILPVEQQQFNATTWQAAAVAPPAPPGGWARAFSNVMMVWEATSGGCLSGPLGPVTPPPASEAFGWPLFFDSFNIPPRINGEVFLPPPLPTLTFAAIGFDQNDASWVRLYDPGRVAFASPASTKPPVSPAPPAPGWASFFDEEGPPGTAATQRWEGFSPAGSIGSVTPQGWARFFDTGPAPGTAARQQWASGFQARGTIVISTPQGWGLFFDSSRIAPTPITTQRWEAFSSRGTIVSITPQGWGTYFDSGKAPGTAANAPFDSGWRFPVPLPSTSAPGWTSFFDFGPAPATAVRQQFGAFQPRGAITSVTPQGWWAFFDAKWQPPYPAALQPWAAFQPRGIVPSATPQGFARFFDSGPQPPPASRQQWAAFQPEGLIVSATPQGFARFFDSGMAPPSTANQPWAAFPPQGTVPPAPFPSGWTAFYDAGQAPGSAARQQWAFFYPQGGIVSITPQGFPSFFDEGAAPGTAANQRWDAFPPTGFVPPQPNQIPWGYGQFFDARAFPLQFPHPFDAWLPQVIIQRAPLTQIGCVILGRACDCGLAHRNLTFYPGADWEIQGNLTYADGTPFNLSIGCQIMWAMADSTGSKVLFLTLGNGITVLNAAQGTCLLLIPRSISLTVPLGTYTDQLRAIDPTGYVSDQWSGTITVAESFFN